MVQEEAFAPEGEYDPAGHNPATAANPEELQNLPLNVVLKLFK